MTFGYISDHIEQESYNLISRNQPYPYIAAIRFILKILPVIWFVELSQTVINDPKIIFDIFHEYPKQPKAY